MGNKWIEELPVGAKFKEIRSEDYDYEPSNAVYERLEKAVLYKAPEFREDEGVLFPFDFFGPTEEFEIVED